ncbi:hypothetical protein CSUI_007588 [Cystoisospora suis]|uniref:Transmembrane protein n=1 Tax=Cystoisospora suis TaxID=483139 RepID=A0A2C6KQG0_9APIC|nr:hypothetical protein CSUI_007588 [Cystoisospora suis]
MLLSLSFQFSLASLLSVDYMQVPLKRSLDRLFLLFFFFSISCRFFVSLSPLSIYPSSYRSLYRDLSLSLSVVRVLFVVSSSFRFFATGANLVKVRRKHLVYVGENLYSRRKIET